MPYAKHLKLGEEEWVVENLLVPSHDSGLGDFPTNSNHIAELEMECERRRERRQNDALETTDPVLQEVRVQLHRMLKRAVLDFNKELLLDFPISQSKPLTVIKHCPREIERPEVNSNLRNITSLFGSAKLW